MKVISGIYKGRKLLGFDIDGTRPTMDRVKESLFAMIQEHLEGSVCLDLYAGSGALGIEALSNGAKKCYFIDQNKIAIQTINKNIASLHAQNQATILLTKDWTFLNSKIPEPFDLIFLDPPYQSDNLKAVLRILDQDLNKIIKPEGLIVCEITRCDLLEEYETLSVYKKRQYGDKHVVIYQKKRNER